MQSEPVVARYREFLPHPALRAHVRAYFSFVPQASAETSRRRVTLDLGFRASDSPGSPRFADGNSSLVFELGPFFHSDAIWRTNPTAARGRIIGAMSRAEPLTIREFPAMLGVFFHGARAMAFTRAPAAELADRIVALEDVWGAPGLELAAELGELEEMERIDHLESLLLQLVRQERDSRLALNVPAVADLVDERRGLVTVESLACAAGVSRQHLTRTFRERMGVSPKVYCRLARFRSALAYVRRGERVDWAHAAADAGYADQSHMIADFRDFSGLTPHALASGRWFHPFIERARCARPTRLAP
jgi:AraC-like DNA-binding protein